MGLGILGISEMKWPGEGDFWSGDYRVVHSGSINGNANVGVILKKSSGMSVKSYYPLVIYVVRLETEPKDTMVVQVYIPTSDYEIDDTADIYDSIK
jgi:hypothetical protein